MDKEQLLLEIKQLIADSSKGLITEKVLNEKIEAINVQLKALNDREDNHKEVKDLKDSVDALIKATADNAAAIKAMTEAPKGNASEKPLSFKDALIAAVTDKAKDMPALLAEVKDTYGERKSLGDYFKKLGNKTTGEMTVKIAVDMLESNVVQSNVATVRLAELDPQRVGIPLTIYPHVTDWMPSKTLTRPTMSLLVVYSYEDGAATKTEGSASSKSSFLLKTVEFKSFFIATYFTLSDETLDDLNEAMEEIAVTGPSKIMDKVDGYILGTAGDDSSAIAGLYTASKMTAFASATTYAAKYPNANEYSVIAAMKHQCEANNYKPDVVVMNPLDISLLVDKKDQIDNTLTDRRLAFDNFGNLVAFNGLRIISSTAQTADTIAVLDSKQLMIGKRKDMTMEIGYNGTDFTEGQKTVVLKVRLAFGVRDEAAVIYCSGLAAAVAAITV